MRVKIMTGEIKKISKDRLADIIRENFQVPLSSVIEVDKDIEAFIGNVEVVEINDEELLNKSVKQILKSKGYNIKNIKQIEIVKESKGKQKRKASTSS